MLARKRPREINSDNMESSSQSESDSSSESVAELLESSDVFSSASAVELLEDSDLSSSLPSNPIMSVHFEPSEWNNDICKSCAPVLMKYSETFKRQGTELKQRKLINPHP